MKSPKIAKIDREYFQKLSEQYSCSGHRRPHPSKHFALQRSPTKAPVQTQCLQDADSLKSISSLLTTVSTRQLISTKNSSASFEFRNWISKGFARLDNFLT